MQEIFKKYKERLVNINSKNRSLALKKIHKKNSFDLSKLNSIDNEMDLNILKFIFNRNTFSISNDPVAMKKILENITEYFTLYHINKIELAERDKITRYENYMKYISEEYCEKLRKWKTLN